MDVKLESTVDSSYFETVVKRDLNSIKESIKESSNKRSRSFYENRYDVQIRDYANATGMSVDAIENLLVSGDINQARAFSYHTKFHESGEIESYALDNGEFIGECAQSRLDELTTEYKELLNPTLNSPRI